MYIVSYQDEYYRHWHDDHLFKEYKDAKEYLLNKGFTLQNYVYVRGKFNWCDGLTAYVMPLKPYQRGKSHA